MAFDSSDEQYSMLPRAIADEDGYPHKLSKRLWTEKLLNRYITAQPPVIVSTLPWLPEAVIIDAMFMIHTKPLRTMADYGEVCSTSLYCSISNWVPLKHLLFDNPKMYEFNSKQFEQSDVTPPK